MNIPRFMLRAVPTCALWVPALDADVYRFRFWPSFYVTAMQVVDA